MKAWLVFAPLLLSLGGCLEAIAVADAFHQLSQPVWVVEEQTGPNDGWEPVGPAFEEEANCLAAIDDTQRCRVRE
jgi:hypothetical protein